MHGLALHAHVARLMPAGLTTSASHTVPLFELCMHAGRSLEPDLSTIGLQAPSQQAVPCTHAHNCVEVRQLSFRIPKPQYMTRFLPYTESAHVLSLRKRNLSMDEAEGFVANDHNNRSLSIQTSVNAAFFLHDRCSVCAGEMDTGKKAHTCAFFCTAACQLENSMATKTAVAYVEFNLLASTRECPPSSVPCVSVHVLSPSRLVSACFTVIDALQILLCSALGAGTIAAVESAATPVPCPTFLLRGMLRVDVTCLHAVVDFYMKCAVPGCIPMRKRAAMQRVLLAVGEYVLRTSVAKPMIVPFVPNSDDMMDTTRHCVWVPMRGIVQTLQKSRIRPLSVCEVGIGLVHSSAASKELARRDFLRFMSAFSADGDEMRSALCEWNVAHKETLLGRGIQKYSAKAGAESGARNDKLDAFLYAVRCFFHTNQQTFFRDELQMEDLESLRHLQRMELELRFVHLLFKKGVSRTPVLFDQKDVCDVISLLL